MLSPAVSHVSPGISGNKKLPGFRGNYGSVSYDQSWGNFYFNEDGGNKEQAISGNFSHLIALVFLWVNHSCRIVGSETFRVGFKSRKSQGWGFGSRRDLWALHRSRKIWDVWGEQAGNIHLEKHPGNSWSCFQSLEGPQESWNLGKGLEDPGRGFKGEIWVGY